LPYFRNLMAFKVAHVPFTFAPDAMGGTEIYVKALADQLRSTGIEAVILAPSCNCVDEAYEHNGLRVRRFRMAPESKRMLRELYGAGDPKAAAAFAQILDEERPDAVHIHALTRAVSILLVRAAKERGIPVFFTYHTPTVSCQRGTLMLWGREMCDGVQDVRRCTGCCIEGRGVPDWLSALLSRVPVRFGHFLERADLSGGLWTALRMTVLIQAQHAAFQALMQEVDGIVALTEWVRDVLVRNGVPRSKITLSRHGLPILAEDSEPLVDVEEVPLRVAFLGRIDKVKGADTLIKALRAAPDLNVELHLYGVTQSAADKDYWAELRRLASYDERVRFLPAVPNHQVVPLLRGFHVLAVPSRCLETGPLVILESLAAGTPVMGSRLGGITEWVRHQENGLLVDTEDVSAWTNALRSCVDNRGLLLRLRRGVRPPRSISNVAQEMAQLYLGCLDAREGCGQAG
jgi:glycosyltransferase involved in cell wall biosynthesis